MRDTPTVYLSGPLLHCTPTEALGWRHEAKCLLGAGNVLDPADRKWVQAEENLTEAETVELVDGDLAMIDRCGVVLWHCWKPSIGSSMEAMYGRLTGKQLVVVTTKPDSAWVRRWADFLTDSLSEACMRIASAYDLESPCRR